MIYRPGAITRDPIRRCEREGRTFHGLFARTEARPRPWSLGQSRFCFTSSDRKKRQPSQSYEGENHGACANLGGGSWGVAHPANQICLDSCDGSIELWQVARLAGLVALVLQSDGKAIAGGQFSKANLPGHLNLARFKADGSVDPSYTPPEAELKKIGITSLVLQPDGKLLVGADGGVIRLN